MYGYTYGDPVITVIVLVLIFFSIMGLIMWYAFTRKDD